jgi:hypothetical protein
MGMRLHKVMGYGLVDLEPNDPRLNSNGLANGDFFSKIRRDMDKRGDDFNDHLDLRLASFKNVPLEERRTSAYGDPDWRYRDKESQTKLYSHIHYGCDDFGLDSVMVIVPYNGMTDGWHRYDDSIDYMEWSHKHSGLDGSFMVNRFTAIYPFIGYNDVAVPEHMSTDYVMNAIRHINDDKHDTINNEILSLGSGGKYTTLSDYYNNVFPHVPASVHEICRYFKIFKDDNTAYKLVPTVYTYFS